jgi:hypothetical protein
MVGGAEIGWGPSREESLSFRAGREEGTEEGIEVRMMEQWIEAEIVGNVLAFVGQPTITTEVCERGTLSLLVLFARAFRPKRSPLCIVLFVNES